MLLEKGLRVQRSSRGRGEGKNATRRNEQNKDSLSQLWNGGDHSGVESGRKKTLTASSDESSYGENSGKQVSLLREDRLFNAMGKAVGMTVRAVRAVRVAVGFDIRVVEDLPVGRQSQQRPGVPIHVVLEVEHSREAGAGGLMLGPGTVGILRAGGAD